MLVGLYFFLATANGKIKSSLIRALYFYIGYSPAESHQFSFV